MKETFKAGLDWTGGSQPSRDAATFSRDLEVATGVTRIPMSAAPRFSGDPTRVNPEQLYVAAISACHALTFLAHAARAGIRIASYGDDAEGILEPSEGKIRMTRVTLRPRIILFNDADVQSVRSLLDKAHRDCFIGNSVTAIVDVQPVIAGQAAAA